MVAVRAAAGRDRRPSRSRAAGAPLSCTRKNAVTDSRDSCRRTRFTPPPALLPGGAALIAHGRRAADGSDPQDRGVGDHPGRRRPRHRSQAPRVRAATRRGPRRRRHRSSLSCKTFATDATVTGGGWPRSPYRKAATAGDAAVTGGGTCSRPAPLRRRSSRRRDRTVNTRRCVPRRDGTVTGGGARSRSTVAPKDVQAAVTAAKATGS